MFVIRYHYLFQIQYLMIIYPIKNTIMNSMTYVLSADNIDICVLIDCGDFYTLYPILKKIGKRIKAVLLTHGHYDHIYGLRNLIKYFPSVMIYTNSYGHEELADSKQNLSYYHESSFIIEGYSPIYINGGDILHFDGIGNIEVISCPGHDPSCLSYKVENNVFTGDAYIPGVNVFTKFPKGDYKLAMISYSLLKQLEADGNIIYCGHHNYDEYVR